MDRSVVMELATSMIAFSGFLVGLFASLYYFNQVKELKIIEQLLFIVIYLNSNILFLYIIKRWIK